MPTLWDEWPSVSVIVAAHNASGTIDNCIRSIGLTRYARYELILVDDGSTDDTGEIMALAAAADLRIKLLRQPRGGSAAARNLGVRHAAGDVVMFVDPDVALSRWAVDHMLQGFEDPRTGAVSGEGRPVRWQQDGLLAAMGWLGTAMTQRALTGLWGLPFLTSGVVAVTSRALAELGPFPAAAGDAELTRHVHQAGYRVALAPLARVHTVSPRTLQGLWQLRSRRARDLLLGTVPCSPGRSSWEGLLLRYERLLPFVPVYSVVAALSMVAGLVRLVRTRAEGSGNPDRALVSADRHDARRALQEAWA